MDKYQKNYRVRNVIGWLIVIVVGYTIWTSAGEKHYDVQVGVDQVKIGLIVDGENPIFINFSEVKSVDLIQEMDPGEKKIGIQDNNFIYGTYVNKEYGEYLLCCYKSVDHFVLITTDDGQIIYNLSTVKKTLSSYESIRDYMKSA